MNQQQQQPPKGGTKVFRITARTDWGPSPIVSHIEVPALSTYPIAGLMGNIGSGKSSVAAILRVHHRFAARSFAYMLKQQTIEMVTPSVSTRIIQNLEGFAVSELPKLTKDIEAESAWKGTVLPNGKTVREFLLWLGDGAREFDPDVWVNIWKDRVSRTSAPIVCPDVRYPNEIDAIESTGGINFFLMPKSPLPTSQFGSFEDIHPSERAATQLHTGYSLVSKSTYQLPGCPNIIPIPRNKLDVVATQVKGLCDLIYGDVRVGYRLKVIDNITFERIA